jgi:hypothetical protein
MMPTAVRSYQEVIDAVRKTHWGNPVAVAEIGTVEAGPLQYPFFKIEIKNRSEDPPPASVFVAAGIHGDEPGGVWAVLEFLKRFPNLPPPYHQFEFTLLPCMNPYGYEHNTRENAQGLDLNRQFRKSDPPKEVRLVKDAVQDRAYSLVLEFHEDVDTPGFYLYELTQDGELSWGSEIIARVGKRFPVNRNSEIEGMPAEGGLIYRGSSEIPFREIIEQRRDWPQAFYHYINGSRHCFTTETPVFLTREERAEIHLTVLDMAIQKRWEQQNHQRP